MKRPLAIGAALILLAGCSPKENYNTSGTNTTAGTSGSRSEMYRNHTPAGSQQSITSETGASSGNAISSRDALDTSSGIGYTASVSTETSGAISKATDLIGKEVKNDQDQSLGKIDNLAVDMQSGRIAYAVLSAGGFLGAGAKYIAVPLQALSPGKEKDTLSMAASKQDIDAAAGFDKNHWPMEASPMWGARNTAPGANTHVTFESGNNRLELKGQANPGQENETLKLNPNQNHNENARNNPGNNPPPANADLKSQVQQTLQTQAGLSADEAGQIQVSVDENGAVTLSGQVKSDDQKNKIAQNVKNMPGVKSLKNELKVQSSSETDKSDNEKP